ncbi:MAG: hypothetical protein PF541_02190 [Prolixibacteraceae bacterium]|jgi:hypothetical protein|nr:hypothetical protein [Prolixibacteraceae bacterium]
MKDILIKSKRIKKELLYLLVSLALADLLNVISIIVYKSSWKEIFTQLGYVFMIGILFYILSIIIRVLVRVIKSFF